MSHPIKKVYAGIGPRETPIPVIAVLKGLSSELSDLGWMLRSGHGKGADQAFEAGTDNKQVFYSVHPDEFTKRVKKIAAEHHGGYHHLNDYVKGLMNRNVQILLDRLADDPVACVIYWQDPAIGINAKGGTQHSRRIAKTFNIPTFNIELGNERQALEEFIGSYA